MVEKEREKEEERQEKGTLARKLLLSIAQFLHFLLPFRFSSLSGFHPFTHLLQFFYFSLLLSLSPFLSLSLSPSFILSVLSPLVHSPFSFLLKKSFT